MDALKIQFPSLMENIRIVESFIENARNKFAIDDDVYGNILVAVTEAVNNATQHGNKLDKNKNVTLTLSPSETQLKFLVTDEGPGFDIEAVPDPTEEANIEKPNGRGIFLIRHLTDQVNFSNNGSTIELTFFLT
jgi:serine/threonine-protein kinase RsbW